MYTDARTAKFFHFMVYASGGSGEAVDLDKIIQNGLGQSPDPNDSMEGRTLKRTNILLNDFLAFWEIDKNDQKRPKVKTSM